MEPFEFAALFAGAFFLTFGLTAYRYFYRVLGAAAGLVLWSAFRKPVVELPGLKEHPGTASVLLLVLLCASGIFLVTRFRRILAFLGGVGTGVVLAGMVESFFSGAALSSETVYPGPPGPMELLAGLVGGVLFLLFERFFALILTTSLGSYICFLVLGGRMTFILCFLFGLVAQVLIFARTGKSKKSDNSSKDHGLKLFKKHKPEG